MIVGTAGHVDHGKTTLVRALTGVDTDRLEEEKARGISIDLGFAYLAGSDGRGIGFVDVPGHERFVRTMVAGAAAIDFALLVVAADDGIMPQTREHLDVLDILDVRRGVVAVTKCDRVGAERLAAVKDDIVAALRGTSLADAVVRFVSATTGDGIEALRRHLMTEATRAAPDLAIAASRVFRMAIDRAFTLTGVGTVVTGTVVAGIVSVNDDVAVLPGLRRARVRSLHAQNAAAAFASTGQRCALALSGPGIAPDTVSRGAWICGEQDPAVSDRIDAEVRLLAGTRKRLGPWSAVSFHCGASAGQARVIVLSADDLASGAVGVAQIILDAPLPLRHGDRFVLRDPGAGRTIGGGWVLDPRGPVRHRRSPERLTRLAAMRPANPASALAALLATGFGLEDLAAFAAARGMTGAARDALRAGLVELNHAKGMVVATPERWNELEHLVEAKLAAFHAGNPDQPGLAGERLRLALGSPGDTAPSKPLFAALRDTMVSMHRIALRGHWLHLPGHVAVLGEEDEAIAAAVAPLLAADRFRPPRVRDLARALLVAEPSVRRACKALVRTGEVMEVAHDHVFLRASVAEMATVARGLTEASTTGWFTAADFRDRLDNGRKVAIQILEYFDRQGLTHRAGDLRRVVRAPESLFDRNL